MPGKPLDPIPNWKQYASVYHDPETAKLLNILRKSVKAVKLPNHPAACRYLMRLIHWGWQ